MYSIFFSSAAQKDAIKIQKSNLATKCQKLIDIIAQDPFQNNPRYEKLVGDLKGFYSRRINVQHRLVYEVDEVQKIIKILRMWTHYD
jgi:Txe/YoeB family toxin of toxin-antitoxin system